MAEDTKWCPRCEANVSISEFYVNQARSDGLSGMCITHQRAAEIERGRALRTELLTLLGNRCAIEGCPNGDPRGWCVDHVNGGGKVERDGGLNTTHRAFLEKVRSNPNEYQILCAYHNQIKKVEDHEHTGRRVYERQTAAEKKVGIGRGNAPGTQAAFAAFTSDSERQRRVSKEGWANATPEQRQERVEKLRDKTVGRKLVTDPATGKRHWAYPGDPSYGTVKPPRPKKLRKENPEKPGRKPLPPGKWSTTVDACIDCGTSERPHRSKERCQRCYTWFIRHGGLSRDEAAALRSKTASVSARAFWENASPEQIAERNARVSVGNMGKHRKGD